MIINILDLIFINFIIAIAIFGGLLNFFESSVPKFISQSYRYGKFSYKGNGNLLISLIELPKSWFKHFYVFALIWSWTAFTLALRTIIFHLEPPVFLLKFLDFVANNDEKYNRTVLFNSTSGLIVITLLTLQCSRRYYETQYIQIFSSNGKINLSHYIVGYLHYFGAVSATLANCEGFVRGSSINGFNISQITFFQYLCILLFLYGFVHQYKSNLILVNLRKDRNGNITSEKHLLPIGGYFEWISSPHMFFEIVMYVALYGIISSSITWGYIVLWVIVNQIETAWLTHKWYKENFKDYPKRFAIIPFIL